MKYINFEIEWPSYIDIKDLRKFITKIINKKGEIIRWYIYEICNSKNPINKKIVKINALVLN